MHRIQVLLVLMATAFSPAVLLTTVVSPAVTDTDYCDPKLCWGNEQHSMCLHKDDTPASECIELWSKPITDSEREEILDTHNRWRDYVAAGKETRSKGGRMPQAANMGAMTWHDEIARIAQRWALRCKFEHDECRNMANLTVGQSISLTGDTNKSPPNMTRLAFMWYDTEIKLFNVKNIDPFVLDPPAGHISQFLWANSYKIGCGYASYKKDKFWSNYLVCDYGPSGNYVDFPMYRVGPPCSACPSGTTCGGDSRYPNLCSPDDGQVPATVGPGVGPVEFYGTARRALPAWPAHVLTVTAALLLRP